MPKFIENRLKKQYGKKSDVPYKIMNATKVMHGSKETAKSEMMDMKHQKDELMRRAMKAKKMSVKPV